MFILGQLVGVCAGDALWTVAGGAERSVFDCAGCADIVWSIEEIFGCNSSACWAELASCCSLATNAIFDGCRIGSLACAGIEDALGVIEPCIVLTCCSRDSAIILICTFAGLGEWEGNY